MSQDLHFDVRRLVIYIDFLQELAISVGCNETQIDLLFLFQLQIDRQLINSLPHCCNCDLFVQYSPASL